MKKRFVFTLAIFQLMVVTCRAVNGIIWSKQKQEFVQLFSIPQFAELQKENLAHIQKQESHNLQRQSVKVVYYQEHGLVMFYNNDTKITGFCGDIWEIFAEYLNFTLVPLKSTERGYGFRLENGSYTGLAGMIERNDAQVILRSGLFPNFENIFFYTQPIHKSRYFIYLQPEWLLDNTWLFTLFSPDTFATVVFFFVFLSLVGYFLQKVPSDPETEDAENDVDFTLGDHVFYSYAIMCAQGYVPEAFIKKFKILSISKSIFSLLIFTAFSSQLIYFMSSRDTSLVFSNLENLITRTKYIMLVVKGSHLYENIYTHEKNDIGLQHEFPRNRIHIVQTLKDLYDDICFSHKYVMYELKYRMAMLHSSKCELYGVSNNHDFWMTFAVSKDNFPHKKSINSAIIRLREVGVLSALVNRWMHSNSIEPPDDMFQVVDLYQVFFIFLIFYCGTLISFAIFMVERMTHRHEQRDTRKRANLKHLRKKSKLQRN